MLSVLLLQILVKNRGATTSECEVKDLTLAQFRSLVSNKGTGWVTDVVRHFRSKTSQQLPGEAAWVCSNDDVLPTLQEVFQVGLNVNANMHAVSSHPGIQTPCSQGCRQCPKACIRIPDFGSIASYTTCHCRLCPST
jgi:hypothetical protein